MKVESAGSTILAIIDVLTSNIVMLFIVVNIIVSYTMIYISKMEMCDVR